MPASLTTATTGLIGHGGTPVPLRGVRVEADVSGLCAVVEITQHYTNRESVPIEAVYVFPLDESAAVCGFDAQIGDVVVVGRIEERAAAFAAYDRAIAEGHGALLLDEERPDVFRASIGNVPPGADVHVRLRYVTELRVEGSGLRFVVPTTVSPRYAPANDPGSHERSDAEAVNPPVAWHVPYGLELTVRLTLPDAATSLESPSHPIRVAWQDGHATVSLAQSDAALDRDFVLSVDASGLDTPRAWIEQDADGSAAIAVTFRPQLSDTPVPSEVIFLVDRSGSMQGSSIDEVRKALRLCLRSMVAGSRFNIIGFGSRFEALFPASHPYNDAGLREADRYLDRLEADLGGTELLPALHFALEGTRDPSLVRNLIVLTDGQVANTDAILALASAHADRTRIFTFGIGSGASHHLVRGLARVGGGSAEFIYPRERIEPKVVRQLGRVTSPALSDVEIDWQGISVQQVPARMPPVFAGSRLVVYGFVTTLVPATIQLRASSAAGPVSFDVRVDPSAVRRGSTVATLAARERLRELEESPQWTRRRGSLQSRGASDVTAEIVALSKRYTLMSRETSFVAVEQRARPLVGAMQLRRVPIALTSGWGGLTQPAPCVALGMARASHASAGSFMADFAPASAHGRDNEDGAVLSHAVARVSSGVDRVRDVLGLFARRATTSAGSPVLAPARDRTAAQMHTLVGLQRADGSWDLTEEFAVAIGEELAILERTRCAFAGAVADRRRWATALAIVWLQDHAAADEAQWGLLVRKALRWLESVPGPPDASVLMAAARAAVSRGVSVGSGLESAHFA